MRPHHVLLALTTLVALTPFLLAVLHGTSMMTTTSSLLTGSVAPPSRAGCAAIAGREEAGEAAKMTTTLVSELRSRVAELEAALRESSAGNANVVDADDGGGRGEAVAASEERDEARQDNDGDDDGSSACEREYRRLNSDRTPGLSSESLDRSRAWIGNGERLRNVARILATTDVEDENSKGLHVVVSGGSISVGNGIERDISIPEKITGPYHILLQDWLDVNYNRVGITKDAGDGGKRPDGSPRRQHRVWNRSIQASNICSMAKRLSFQMKDFADEGISPDLFVLEFAVNDYEGHQENVFFDGFQEMALCAEVVVRTLLESYPNCAVMFFEFRSATLDRKTADLIHLGVAKHYEIPIISYSEAMMPQFLRLLSMLNASDSYTIPNDNRTLLPYPYGCHPCTHHGMLKGQRPENRKGKIAQTLNSMGHLVNGCMTMCGLSGLPCTLRPANLPKNRVHCHHAMFGHDSTHPSAVGQRVAKDLLVHAITMAGRDLCEGKEVPPHVISPVGWLAKPQYLRERGNFVMVNDTKRTFWHMDRLVAKKKSSGFSFYKDSPGKPGYIATTPQGGEWIEFDIKLPHHPCYAVYVAVLRSYEEMGTFDVEVEDLTTNKTTVVEGLDGLWKARISVWSDIQVTRDDDPSCTGRCVVRVRTRKAVPGRMGKNKVKVLTLSVRKCASAGARPSF